MRRIYLTLALMTLFVGCGVPKSDYDKLQSENEQFKMELEAFSDYKSENERLKSELEECNNGAEKLIAEVQNAYSNKNYSIAVQKIILLSKKHPESPKNKEFDNLLKVIEKEELAEQKRIAAAEKERIRLENINNTGMWTVGNYVDDFGEPTKAAYIRNTTLISGTFSNTATQNSDLNVQFLISNSSDISIMLYEYAGNNPVKSSSSDTYQVLVQDKDGNRLKLRATNYSDRLSFDKLASRQIHNALMKGGSIKFKIYEIDTPTTEYDFSIQNADWYDNAYSLKDAKK